MYDIFRYAFVEFENTDDAKEALDSCNNTEIEGRSVRLEFSQSRGEGGGRGGSGQCAVNNGSVQDDPPIKKNVAAQVKTC